MNPMSRAQFCALDLHVSYARISLIIIVKFN